MKLNVGYVAPKAINLILILGLAAFEIFNMATTASALIQLTPMILGIFLAVAFCATDVAGLARIVTPAKTMRDEPMIIKMLFGIWAIIAIINAFLTWFSLQIYFDETAIKVPLVLKDVTFIFPIVLAFVVFVIHFTVIYSLGIFLEKVSITEGTHSYRSTSQPAMTQRPSVSSPTIGQRPTVFGSSEQGHSLSGTSRE